jgi:hypothetical protein
MTNTTDQAPGFDIGTPPRPPSWRRKLVIVPLAGYGHRCVHIALHRRATRDSRDVAVMVMTVDHSRCALRAENYITWPEILPTRRLAQVSASGLPRQGGAS